MVRGCPVDISYATISFFLYGPTTGHSWSLNTAEFDYRWYIVRSGTFQRNAEQREAVILWLAKYIALDREHAEWVATPRLGIRKATLNFVAKFFWLLVCNRVSPTKADNSHETEWSWDSGVPIWHYDRLTHPTGTLDIGLIRDEANVVAPCREPQVEVPPLGADLADTVGFIPGQRLVGIGGIVRETNGKMVMAFAKSTQYSTNNFCELQSTLHGIEWCHDN
ncbi:hypothetical protein H5410_062041 [Solanum commersonii]|uniref:Putative plant transposon protein domain-containing protein n=1 Tax=Solanum commersonii TaxID=4109 RepID=A0A9J5W9B7_SOLCO|nr:hypothetical protein H5410_062041 [Solanum commersonii]